MPPRTENKTKVSASSSKETKTSSYKSSPYLTQKAAGYMLAAANASKRENKH